MNSINSVSEFHRLLSLPEPRHPLVSVINLAESVFLEDKVWEGFINRFYCVALKREAKGKIRYGQQHYDYDNGVLSFTAPNQVQYLDLQHMECGSGHLLIFHPDFLLTHSLASTINGYGFFLTQSTRRCIFPLKKKMILSLYSARSTRNACILINTHRESSCHKSSCCLTIPTAFTSDSLSPARTTTINCLRNLNFLLRSISIPMLPCNRDC